MSNFNEKIIDVLKKDLRFIDQDGDLLRSEVIDKAWKTDEKLVELLLTEPEFKKTFFSNVKGYEIFNIAKFVDFIQDKNFLNDSYTKFKNKIGLMIDGKYMSQRGEVALVWPYKDCVLEGGMSDEETEREEIFFNEILAQDEIDRLLDQKVFTNCKKFTKKGAEEITSFSRDKNGIIADNLVIKGNNLLALHSIKKQYSGKIKLIYIDPPYNTGNEGDTFAYNNTFKHSTWLTFMKNRMEVARELIREDGFIAIAIDHAELFYLGAVADEIFGRENRVGLVTVLHNPKGRNLSKFFSANNEFMLIYAKNIDLAEFNRVAIDDEVKASFDQQDSNGRYRLEPFMRARTVWSRENKPNNWYPIYVSQDLSTITHEKKDGYHELYPITNNGKEMAWKNIRESFIELNKDGYFSAEKENGKIVIYHKYKEQQVYKSVWTDKKYQSEFNGTNVLKKMIGNNRFSYPKSIYLVSDTIRIMTSNDDVVLDFFGGSGTTAHAVLEANNSDDGQRRFIVIEQMDYIHDVTCPRIQKAIEQYNGGSFIYLELKKYNQKFIDLIQDANNSKTLEKIWIEMKEKSFLNWNIDFRNADLAFEEWKNLEFKKQQHALIQLLNKNQLYVNLSEIGDGKFECTKIEKKLNSEFYNIE